MPFSKRDLDGALDVIRKSTDLKPTVGIILGSGLGPLADHIKNPVIFPYKDLPGFPISKVQGHEGSFFVGTLGGVSVACLKGRVHLYEGMDFDKVKMLIRSLKCLGCHTLILTNAVGSLRSEVVPGDIVTITDHINAMGAHPLVGVNDEEFGPRFVSMDNAYDEELRKKIHKTALEENVELHDGVYLATMGPTFETHAEIRAYKSWGAEMVGMSVVPEVIIARHCGLKVLAISAVTNLAAGLSEMPLSHEQTLEGAKLAEQKLCHLVEAFLTKHASEF
ncbi:MAG: purine-nucleoside phosphorylase [Gammaproteobacteria bacterium]|jgi:xanthosine phosphorylase